VARIAMLIIRFYQRAISPLLPSTCRFEPSCSHYGYEAFRTHGFFRGGYLTLRRILRCNPLHPGGYDPVPDRENKSSAELRP
jgi:hypothetical protein